MPIRRRRTSKPVAVPLVARDEGGAAELERLRRSEARLRSLVEHATEMLAIFAPDGTTIYESPSNAVHVGWAPEELVGTSAFALIHPDDVGRVADAFARALAAPAVPQHVEFRYRHKDGRWRVLSSIGVNMTHDPDVAGIVVSSRDLTEQRALEAQLRQAQKMEAIGRLAGGVAHDFANVCTAMMMNVEALLLGRPDDDPVRRGLEQLLRITDRGISLTAQLVALSRHQPVERRRVDLNDVAMDIEVLLRRLIPPAIRIATRTAPALAPVLADRGQMEQVILNLCLNARDAMPSGGTLSVETANESLDAAAALAVGIPAGEVVCLTVRDTGAGMTHEVQERVFEPFFTTKASGSGLGLSTVYSIVAQSGGAVCVESEVGHGCTFRVYLPAAEGAGAPA